MPLDASATLGDLLPFALGMALSPGALILAMLWVTTRHGRRKALVLLFGMLASTTVVLYALARLDWALRAPVGSGRLRIVAGLFALGFGLTCLSHVVGFLRGKPTWAELRRARGLADGLEHARWRQIFAQGARSAVLDPRAPQSLVPAGIILALHRLHPARELAVILAFAAVSGLGVASVLAIAVSSGSRTRRALLGFRHWMEANGGAVLLVANVLLAITLFWKAYGYFR